MPTATANPPSYEAALAQLRKLEKDGVSTAVKKEVEMKAAEKMSEDDTAKDLVDEITELAESAVAIDKGFQEVFVGLGKVDNSGFVDSHGKPLPMLQPTWKKFQDDYTNLLWRSRETATSTEVYLGDFNEVVLPMVNDAIEDPGNPGKFQDALAELNAFIARHNPYAGIVNGDDAQSHSQEFTNLRRKLEEFKEMFDDFAKKQEGEISQEIENVRARISELNLEIKKCDDIVIALGVALGITVFATAVGAYAALAAFGPLGPMVAIGIFGVVAAITELGVLIAYIKKGNDFRKERRAKEQELKDLEDKLALLKSIQAAMEAQKSTISDVASRLDRFAAIWAMITHDARLVRDQFKAAGDSATLAGLKYRVHDLMKTYAPLKAGLGLYAKMIDRSDARRLPPF